MKIGIIGGTGVYDSSFMSDVSQIHVDTPYGRVSLLKGYMGEKEVFFLERHAEGHKLIPTKVNFKANITSLKLLGADYIISTAAVGAINNCKVGDFVILDQFIDFTRNRSCTFFDEDNRGVVHVDMTNPYCTTLRKIIIDSFKQINAPVVEKGTYICTEGPRFETPAEINMFKILGADVVGMTNVPEVVLARESAICYATISLVTNYAAGISASLLTNKEVNENMERMTSTLKDALKIIINKLNDNRTCECRNSLSELNTLK